MLEKKNQGIVTHLETNEIGKFKYFFMALDVSICGFKSTCRPVLCVDGSFLKHKCGGHMLVVIALNVNNHLYLVAFAVVDYENNIAWIYFMLKLRDTIREVENLMFVSDRHINIAHALSVIFLKAHHGACIYHIKTNTNHKFKTNHCDAEFELAAYTYHISKFEHHFENIKVKDLCLAAYLEEISVEKWNCAFSLGIRYNVITRNYAESFNNKSRDVKKYLITTFVDFLIFTLKDLFFK